MRTRNFYPEKKGMVKLCDWFFISGHSNKIKKVPKTIFIKADPPYWEKFFKEVLPTIKSSFILSLVVQI